MRASSTAWTVSGTVGDGRVGTLLHDRAGQLLEKEGIAIRFRQQVAAPAGR